MNVQSMRVASKNVRKGLKRLYLVLTVSWALFCTVIVPLKMEWDGQQSASGKYREDVKMCDQLMVQAPLWDMTQNCYQRIMENYQNTLDFYAYKRFWMYDALYWKLALLAVALPPVFIWGADVTVRWVWRGFRQQPNSGPDGT